MGENPSTSGRAQSRNRSRKCKRLDGLCNLTEEQKAERDAKMRAWLNQRKIDRVADASGLLSGLALLRYVNHQIATGSA